MSRLLAVVVALTGLVLVPATAAQAATACQDRFGAEWYRGPYSYAGLGASVHQNTKMLLDAASPYPTSAPGNLHMWHNNGPTQNQLWCLDRVDFDNGSYEYRVRNYQTGLCLDPKDTPVVNGTRVWLWWCKASNDSTFNSQLWAINSNGKRSTPQGSQYVYYFRRLNTDKCLDVMDYNPNDGAVLQMWTCSNGANQLYY
jgi:hypothetical protein